VKRLKTTLWLSFGLVSVTICLVMSAYIFGLMPDGYKAEVESRAKVAEALAVQLAGAVNRNEGELIEETLSSVVKRNPDILSVAFRGADGTILISEGDHSSNWIEPEGGDSMPTHVSVPLLGIDGPQGKIEIAFGPPTSGARFFDIPVSLFVLLGFLAAAGFIIYSLFLRRTLHELDPGRVIPERVQRAFDTLSEGVIILDERERILLVNSSFAKLYGVDGQPAIGSKISMMPWRMVDGSAKAGGYPWHAALSEGREMREDILSLRTSDGTVRNLNVNATVFAGEKGETIGAIVTLNDMTGAKRNAEQLVKAVELLKQTQQEVDRQKQELHYLSNHDSLTGCLNRRAFFARFEPELERARRDNQPTTVLMLDIDGLRDIKENYGPAIADSLVISAASTLRTTLYANTPVARYGGEGFSVALVGTDGEGSLEIANAVQAAFRDATKSIAPGLDQATLGIGMSIDANDACSSTELVRRADQALHAAMRRGPGQIGCRADARARIDPITPLPQADHDPASDIPEAGSQTELEAKQSERIETYHAQTRFLERTKQSITRAKRDEKSLAILKIGVTSWEYFEEALGEELSQTLLRFAQRQVELALREQDNVTLLTDTGEMLVELSELEQPDDVTWVVKRILDKLRDPIRIGEQSVFVVCKIGAALYPHDGSDATTLARHAGIAMRRAKEENLIDGLKFYSAEMTQTSLARLDIETGTREALQRNEFELFFQPIINTQTGALTSVESLLRCTSPRLAGVRIDQIINVAERSSLIAEIDIWVLNAALNQMQKWCEAGLQLPKISINISAKQLTNIEFVDHVFAKIQAVPFSPSRIQVEVTETARMADVEVAAPQLKRLQQLGVHIALDDFGTGQASLTYLQRLHPDLIKIDRSFVEGVHKNHASATMVGAMTVMAHCLGLKVVAEGVETEEELEFLRKTKCDEIQGYLVSKPMPSAAMSEWMKLFAGGNDQTASWREGATADSPEPQEALDVHAA